MNSDLSRRNEPPRAGYAQPVTPMKWSCVFCGQWRWTFEGRKRVLGHWKCQECQAR